MQGMYSYMADAGLFLECGNNKNRLPVAMKGDNIALERAYLNNRYQPGKSLLVSIEGHLATRKKMEGEGTQQVVIVDQFLSIQQQENCTGIVPPSSLANTYWKLVEINGKRLDADNNWQYIVHNNPGASGEIHFIIRQNNKINGFSGCNNFSGNVYYTEDDITIGPLMSTRKACPTMALENTILTLISQADTYHIKGGTPGLISG
ncbi:MAG: META domain-containing protein [gamma proteobacterium symbiont of Lucinoma myriamae]|nr:META domain-containing protein [gamma proteobacterium symbiont of Lucinoma myriamae]